MKTDSHIGSVALGKIHPITAILLPRDHPAIGRASEALVQTILSSVCGAEIQRKVTDLHRFDRLRPFCREVNDFLLGFDLLFSHKTEAMAVCIQHHLPADETPVLPDLQIRHDAETSALLICKDRRIAFLFKDHCIRLSVFSFPNCEPVAI